MLMQCYLGIPLKCCVRRTMSPCLSAFHIRVCWYVTHYAGTTTGKHVFCSFIKHEKAEIAHHAHRQCALKKLVCPISEQIISDAYSFIRFAEKNSSIFTFHQSHCTAGAPGCSQQMKVGSAIRLEKRCNMVCVNI